MKISSKEVIESVIELTNNLMIDYLPGGAEYLSKLEFTGKDFPKLFVFYQEAAQIQQQTNNVRLTFRFLDVVGGINNKWRRDYEIKSDMEQAASLLIDLLQSYNVLVSPIDESYQPVYATYGDELSGIEMSVTFPIMKPCLIPIAPIIPNNSFPYTFPFTLS